MEKLLLRKRSLFFALVGIIAISLSGCAGQPLEGKSQLVALSSDLQTAPVSPVDFLAAPQKSATLGTTLAPPSAGSVAIAQAIARRNIEAVVGPLRSGFVGKLALYTNTTFGQIQPNNSVISAYTNKLVWVFLRDAQFKPGNNGASVGPSGKPVQAKLPVGTVCHAVWLADAATGAYLMGYTSCPVSGKS